MSAMARRVLGRAVWIVPAICAVVPLTRSCKFAVTSLATPWIVSVPGTVTFTV